MNLQKLDKLQSLRRIDLKNEYKAYLWKKNKSHIKYIESLSNHIYECGLKFVALWENLDFFLAVKDKYDDVDDAKDFIESCLAELEEDKYSPFMHFLYKYSELSEIITNALKKDDLASIQLTCRFIVFASTYDLLFEVVAKVLSGYTFDVAYYEITNKILPADISELEQAHEHFSDYFVFAQEKEYKFTPYKLYTANEYVLNYDISALVNIVSDITDANVYIYDIVIPDRESKIFDEPSSEEVFPAKLYEYESEPYIDYRGLKIEISPDDLQKEIFVCSIYLDLDDGIIRTISQKHDITAEDVAQSLRYLLGKKVYIHPASKTWAGNQIEISWAEVI